MICDQNVKNRIKRAQGQMSGVLNMMENDLACEDIITQLKAIRSSIDKAIGVLTADNILQALNFESDLDKETLQEALNLVIKGR
mgnify:CR=1 FL=1